MERLAHIISVAESLGEISDIIGKHIEALERQINAVRMEFYKKILPMSRQYSQQRKELEKLIERNPQLFVKPRTIEVNGIKFGMKKSKGKIIVHDSDKTLEKIKTLLKDKKEFLIEQKEVLLKSGLAQLSDHEMEAVGVSREADDMNAVFIQIKAMEKRQAVLQKLIEDYEEKIKAAELKIAS
jgi:translation elongation factor EF-1beta